MHSLATWPCSYFASLIRCFAGKASARSPILKSKLELWPQDMHRLHKFFRLSAPERFLLVRATALLVIVRTALWLLPFKTLQRSSAKLAQIFAPSHKENLFSTERVVWAVEVASRYVPRVTCLTQALAAQTMLRLGGIPTSLRIGVAKGTGSFEAHAWLESGGKILIGGAEAAQRYTQLVSFGAGER